MTAKLDRWTSLADRFFDDMEPGIVAAAQQVEATHTRQPANRNLFKTLEDAEGNSRQRILDEQLELSYMELYGYVPSVQEAFDDTIKAIREAEGKSHERLSDTLQTRLLDQQILKGNSITVGNALRSDVKLERKRLRGEIEKITAPLRSSILHLIQLEDAQLLDKAKRGAVASGKAE